MLHKDKVSNLQHCPHQAMVKTTMLYTFPSAAYGQPKLGDKWEQATVSDGDYNLSCNNGEVNVLKYCDIILINKKNLSFLINKKIFILIYYCLYMCILHIINKFSTLAKKMPCNNFKT